MKEFAINYSLSGLNSEAKGGELIIDQCVFSNLYNIEKGYVVKNKGVKYVTIQNSVFENSYLILKAVSLNGTNHYITNCLVNSCGAIKTSVDAKKEKVKYTSPKWEDHKLFIPSQKSYLLKANNGINRIGLSRSK